MHGIFEDNLRNMWIYPDPQQMSAQFSVTNSGNTAAFVKVCQGAISYYNLISYFKYLFIFIPKIIF